MEYIYIYVYIYISAMCCIARFSSRSGDRRANLSRSWWLFGIAMYTPDNEQTRLQALYGSRYRSRLGVPQATTFAHTQFYSIVTNYRVLQKRGACARACATEAALLWQKRRETAPLGQKRSACVPETQCLCSRSSARLPETQRLCCRISACVVEMQ